MTVMLGSVSTTQPSRRRHAPAADVHRLAPGHHQPVLLAELLQTLGPRPGQQVIDATLGGGGTSAAFLDNVLPGGRVLALDRDPVAVERARQRFAFAGDAFRARHARFSDLGRIAAEEGLLADIVVMDLGISSIQLDDPERGFSFQVEGPLDMRMDPLSGGRTAADIVNQVDRDELAQLISDFGQERHARAIARALGERRQLKPITTTTELAAICAGAIPRRFWPPRIHPATRTFMALRIAVNNELEELSTGLSAAIQILRPGGRLGVISFHSLEDTTAKRLLHNLAMNCVCPPPQPICTCAHRASLSLPSRRAIRPSPEEVAKNPRARSALLRTAVRLPQNAT
ncbi:MAG: 16S rRNA (cytosine(1402)-N(4))-methyltransferase RsmH [Candidatus Dormibacteraeota bacterium]|nr:16S rRNA (cytosine(1402)-N(4))-methyltransferase RsmH [Candidatus Dormibacteraeota bacterium]